MGEMGKTMRKADENYVRFMIIDEIEDFAKTLGLQYHPISQRTIGKMDSRLLNLPDTKRLEQEITEISKKIYVGNDLTDVPTLLGKINAIVDHLGIEFEVQQEKTTVKATKAKTNSQRKGKTMNNNDTDRIDEKLDEILGRVDHLKTKENPEGNLFFHNNLSVDEAKQAIRQLFAEEMLELVSDDEYSDEDANGRYSAIECFEERIARNNLRAELRAKLTELLGENHEQS